MFDCAIIGGGIVGLATAVQLGRRQPGVRLLVLEKETDVARHQTGRNSGVIHSGVYYKPGSLKAQFARQGNQSMIEFCRDHGIAHDICGKVIVATEPSELALLENLHRRGVENRIEVQLLSSDQVRELEPHVRGLKGMRVPSTGIVNYGHVCRKYVDLIRQQGGVLKTGTRVERIRSKTTHAIDTTAGAFEARFVINCGGLYSDRLARRSGVDPGARIVPFRGEYYELTEARRPLVKGLIYPVPNPEFPFLGVHFTRMIDGSVHAGPNAVLAFHREGYHKSDINLADLAETLVFPGFWRMAWTNLGEGMKEYWRSLSKSAFVASLQRLVPAVQSNDLIPSDAGVRAQALLPDGKLVDDFLILRGAMAMHVCNAPSPAATASLEIGRKIAEDVPDLSARTVVSV